MASPFGKSKLENRTGKRVQLSKVGAKGEAANKKPYSLRLLYLNTDPSSRSFQSELLDAWRPKGIHRPNQSPVCCESFRPIWEVLDWCQTSGGAEPQALP